MTLKSTKKTVAKTTVNATARTATAGKVVAKKAVKKAPASKAEPITTAEAAAHIDARIAALGDWRGEALAQVRALIHAADPAVVEEVKWRGTPVWSHDGIVCTGESYKDKIKLTFARGAALPDPQKLFNSSLDGGTRRALDIFATDRLDATAFKALIKAAVAANVQARAKKSK